MINRVIRAWWTESTQAGVAKSRTIIKRTARVARNIKIRINELLALPALLVKPAKNLNTVTDGKVDFEFGYYPACDGSCRK